MKLFGSGFFALLLVASALASGVCAPAAASAAVPDTSDVTHFYPDSLWADRAAVDSAKTYRDSLRRELGTAQQLSADPLSAGRGETDFSYNTSYSVGQSNTSWANSSRYSSSFARMVLTNNTDITLERYLSGGAVSPRQTKNSETELAYRFSPDLSFGSRAKLFRFLATSSGLNTAGDREDKDEYQLSGRSRARPTPYLRTDLNLFGGYLNNERPTFRKRGVSGDASSKLNLLLGSWSTVDVAGQLTGNATRATLSDTSAAEAETHDRTRGLRGTISLLPSGKVQGMLNGGKRSVRTQSPVTGGSQTQIQEILVRSTDLAATLQAKLTQDRYYLVSRKLTDETRDFNVQTSQGSGRDDHTWLAEAHERPWDVKTDGTFQTSSSENDFTRRTTSERVGTTTTTVPAGYRERVRNRVLDGALSRNLGSRLTLRLQGSVRLDTYRYEPVPQSRASLVDRDQYRQLFLLETRYNPGKRWSSGVTYQQERNLTVNLPASHSSGNFEDRIYRLTWNWSYQLAEHLTATQRNNVSSTYRKFTFIPASNRLTMEYQFVTTLEAVVMRNLRVTTTHSARFQPSGQYVLDPLTGMESFFKSDDSELYSLESRIAYSPTNWLTLNFQPSYQSDRRVSAQEDRLAPLRTTKNLRLTGGLAVNRRVGTRGTLAGDLNRTFLADRSTAFTQGVPNPAPRAETDYWQGRLDFTWTY